MDPTSTASRTSRSADAGRSAQPSGAVAAVEAALATVDAALAAERDAYHAEATELAALRERLDGIERALRAGDASVDRPAAAELSRQHEARSAELARRRTALSKLELARRSVESARLLVASDGPSATDAISVPPVDVQVRIIEAQEAERSRLAQEIHDGPAQALSNAIFQVEYVERLVHEDAAGAVAELRVLRDQLRRELGDVRGTISQLRPPRLLQLGLDGAIADVIESFHAVTGVEVTQRLEAPATELDEAAQTVVLRVVQEALQNVRKHAAASRVTVSSASEGARWVLEVGDDGRGFDPDAAAGRSRRSFGLQVMRERAQLIGAGLEVRSRPNGGTRVTLSIPVGDGMR